MTEAFLWFASFFLVLAAMLGAAMMAAWWIALKSGQSGWIDAVWSLAVGIAGVGAALAGQAISLRSGLVAVLVAVWSIRLATHIARRSWKGGDDPRYAFLRESWGSRYRQRLFGFLQIQAGAGFLLAISVWAAAHNPLPSLRFQDWLGVVLLVVSIAGEALADAQLARFRGLAANKGRICDVGLWGLSRHPNYFFEWLVWLAYVAIGIDLDGSYPIGWLTLVGPVLMYWLLVHASGVPPLEAHMLRSRGEAFRDYTKRVNAFWPGLPKSPMARRA
jgi:steroid 5-alpha reductase family enzyme